MNSIDFISVDEVVAEAAIMCGDEHFYKQGRSFYVVAAHRTIEKLAINSLYQLITKDVFNWNKYGDCKVEMPKNGFNLKEVYLFNSTCSTTCSCQSNGATGNTCWTAYSAAYWKRTFNTFGSTNIATAKLHKGFNDGVMDKFIGNFSFPFFNRNVIYFGIQNGVLAFSSEASSYTNIRFVYNGFGSENDELPLIPRLAREAVVDNVSERVCFSLKIRYPEYRQHWNDCLIRLKGTGGKVGSWTECERSFKKMDNKVKEDMREYLANMEAK